MHGQAYSVLRVKAIDAERRVITGVATTPTPDRVGDVIEPRGVSFKNPLPLLLYHDSQKPVGTVKFDKPTDDGITFSASLPEIEEPGPLRDRVQEAWQSIKAGLIRGVSVGFRALDDGIELLRSGGLRFTATEVLELSLVAIPANAEARIETIKSLDRSHLAASGRSSNLPGVTGRSTTGTTMTISEQLTAARTALQTKNARLDELNDVETKDGLALSEDQQKELGPLTNEVQALTAKVHRLSVMEAGQLTLAKGLTVTGIDDGSAARGHQSHVTVKSNLPPGIEFARYAICKMASLISMREGNFVPAIDIAKQRYPDNQRIQMLLKAAVPAGTTTHVTWAAPLVDPTNLTSEFVAYLNPMTIIGKFGQNGIPSLSSVPFNVRITGQTSGGDAWWVGEGLPKPLTKFDFDARTLLFNKVATIAVLTKELARHSSPASEALVRDALAKAVVRRIDRTFIDPAAAAVANVSPASLTNGVTPLDPTGTGDADDIRADVVKLLAEFIQANQDPTTAVLIMPNTLALAASMMTNALGQPEFPGLTMRGGTLMGIPVIASQYAANESGSGNLVVMVNASEIFLADDGAVTIDASTEASLQMLDNPTNASSTGTATSMVSLWQTNSIGLLAERTISWVKARTTAVSYIDDANWGSVGSPG